MSAADAHALGIVTAVTEPAKIESAIRELMVREKSDKYNPRALPENFKALARLFAEGNIEQILSGRTPENSLHPSADRILKVIGYKAPLALKLANEIMDMQKNKPIPEAVEIELERLAEIFASDDALEGLSSMGRRRPEFKGT